MHTYDNADQAWNALLRDVQQYGLFSSPRGIPCLELIGYQTSFNMEYPIVTAPARRLGYKFQAAEAAHILSGSNLVSEIAPYSKEISQFSDDGVTFFGSYGVKIRDQIAHAANAIVKDKDTRQAVINIWRENPRPSKDIPCTLSLQWLVRSDKLHCIASMRSSDAWLGWPYDVYNFSMITRYLALYIRQLGRPYYSPGVLTLTAGSQHLYKKDQERVKEVLDSTEPFRAYSMSLGAGYASPKDFVDSLWHMANTTGSLNWLRSK